MKFNIYAKCEIKEAKSLEEVIGYIRSMYRYPDSLHVEEVNEEAYAGENLDKLLEKKKKESLEEKIDKLLEIERLRVLYEREVHLLNYYSRNNERQAEMIYQQRADRLIDQLSEICGGDPI